MAIKFNGKDIPSFVKVNNIRNSILPSITQTTMKVNGRVGSYDFGNEIGSRNIEVTITIVAENQSDLRTKIRQLADWLYFDEPKKFVILDEDDKYYMAKFTGESVLNEILHIGQGTLNFTCTDPYAYGQGKVYDFNPTDSEPYGFKNEGGTDTYPRMEFEFTEKATEFSIIANDEYLYFGNPIEAGINTPVDTNPIVLDEEFANLNGWTSAVSLLDGGVIDKNFTSNGYSIRVSNWGNMEGYNGWHGASLIKGLPYPLESFKIKFRIGLHGSKIEQLGRIHLYGLDKNGQRIFATEFRDGNIKAMSPYARWIVGNKELLATYGQTGLGYWTGFEDGYYDIARRKNKEGLYEWRIWIARYNPVDKTTFRSLIHEWIDVNQEHAEKLASIQIHIGAYQDVEPNNDMYIATLRVYDESPIPAENEVPYIFKQGDILVIDNESGGIFLNGEEFYEYLDPASKFVKFKKGMNGLSVSPAVVTNGKVSFRERWL